MANDYQIRKATVADIPAILHHREAMFSDMGMEFDRGALEAAFTPWVRDAMARGLYHGWIAEAARGEIAGGAGLTVLPWPPAPPDLADHLGFVYNVYTEPAHRRRGVARRMMEAVHAWCRENGLARVALHASDDGRRLYESLGYEPTNEMRLRL